MIVAKALCSANIQSVGVGRLSVWLCWPHSRNCLCSTTIQRIGVELTGGVSSRPVSPKLAQQAVLAKPPYFMLKSSLNSPECLWKQEQMSENLTRSLLNESLKSRSERGSSKVLNCGSSKV